jgi:hypothetical protein
MLLQIEIGSKRSEKTAAGKDSRIEMFEMGRIRQFVRIRPDGRATNGG